MIEWIHWMILGLGIDILGIWMLASPLLMTTLWNKEVIDKKTKDAVEEYKRVKDQKSNQADSEFATWPGVAHIEVLVLQLYQSIIKEKTTNRKRAFIALIIISIGFGVQMWASYLQYQVK